jgi:hypothetical protein
MNTQQALQIIKQTIDASLKAGAITTTEHASAIIQAFALIQNTLNTKENV